MPYTLPISGTKQRAINLTTQFFTVYLGLGISQCPPAAPRAPGSASSQCGAGTLCSAL